MWQLRIEVHGLPAYCMNIEECMKVEVEIEGKPWYHDIKAYIKDGEYLSGSTNNKKKFIRHMACQFFLSREVLYKRNHDITLLRYINATKANHLMEDMHKGLLGAHANGTLLVQKIMKASYYWLTTENDCIKHVKMCHHCHVYHNRKNVPPEPLHFLTTPWPFSI